VDVLTASDAPNAEGYLSFNITYSDGQHKKINPEFRGQTFEAKVCSLKQLTGVWVQNVNNDSWVGTFS